MTLAVLYPLAAFWTHGLLHAGVAGLWFAELFGLLMIVIPNGPWP